MEYNYDFSIIGDGSSPKHGTISIPRKNNMVEIGLFRPNSILNGHIHNPVFTGVASLESISEFENDCQKFVYYLNKNKTNLSDLGSYTPAFEDLVEEHINKFHRIFINDLMAYLDVYILVLRALGGDESMLKELYIVQLFCFVKNNPSIVMEAFGNNVPFVSCVRFQNLKNYIVENHPYLL